MTEFREGDRVSYRPGRRYNSSDQQDKYGVVVLPAGHTKETSNGGSITAGPGYVFVHFDGEGPNAQAARVEDLELEERRPCPDCGQSDGPYPNFDRPYSGPLPSGCPTCGWCF